jgi:hypothetical protein
LRVKDNLLVQKIVTSPEQDRVADGRVRSTGADEPHITLFDRTMVTPLRILLNDDLPAISGNAPIRLLHKDGWESFRSSAHGVALRKYDPIQGCMRLTAIPKKNGSLPPGTHGDIFSPKQTDAGRKGLLELIARFG